MDFAPFSGISNAELKRVFPKEYDTFYDEAIDLEWLFYANEWSVCGEGPPTRGPRLPEQDEEPEQDDDDDQYDTLEWPEEGRNITVQIVQINRFKKSGIPNKDVNRQRPTDKYAEMKFWKRAKNVQMQRQSRSKNTFDASETKKEEWPYDGRKSPFLDGLRKTKLGAGW
jgi:hypothetical protein